MTRRPAKRSKYGAQPTVIDGIRFASKKEARRWQELRLLEKAGEIYYLKRQVPFDILINGIKVCKYIADFTYRPMENIRFTIVEDAKGVRTPEYKLKRKLMKAIYGIEVKES